MKTLEFVVETEVTKDDGKVLKQMSTSCIQYESVSELIDVLSSESTVADTVLKAVNRQLKVQAGNKARVQLKATGSNPQKELLAFIKEQGLSLDDLKAMLQR